MLNNEERRFYLEKQDVDVSWYDCDGRVLDIGGGGEGIIGQLLKDKVVAIDPNIDELKEAPDGPLKIVMDSRELKFLDNSFDAVTSFFTLMYIKCCDHKKVFEEVYRVLKDGCEFTVWDVIIPEYDGGIRDIFVFHLDVNLGSNVDSTGYGTKWAGRKQDEEYFINIAGDTGFKVIDRKRDGQTYCIRFRK